MDAPPEREDCRPFIAIAGYLKDMGLSAPRVLAADLDRGFLLLTDLGSTQYLSETVAHPERAGSLYVDAIRALNTLQSAGASFQAELPPYDEHLLRLELSLFSDWLCGRHLDIHFSTDEQSRWRNTCDLLVDNALKQPAVFVHRDYHSRNLMVLEKNNPGILDFQDSVRGPYTYDLVSLLKDCYVTWPGEQVRHWALDFFQRRRESLPASIDESVFIRHFELMGVQRQLKAAGIFARLLHRDNKSGYIADIPRTLSYVLEIAPRYVELEFVAELIADRVLPGLQASIV